MSSFSDLTFDQVFVNRTTGVRLSPKAIAIAEFQFPAAQQSIATCIKWSITFAAFDVFEARHTWEAVKCESELNLESEIKTTIVFKVSHQSAQASSAFRVRRSIKFSADVDCNSFISIWVSRWAIFVVEYWTTKGFVLRDRFVNLHLKSYHCYRVVKHWFGRFLE